MASGRMEVLQEGHVERELVRKKSDVVSATRCLSHFTSTQIILCAVYADT